MLKGRSGDNGRNLIVADSMADSALVLQILIAFGGGVISFLSPCVLPLLPGYLSMMSGYSVSEIEEGGASTRRLVRVVLLFIAGFTVVFAAFGATASSIGRFLAANLPTASRIAGGVVVVFGLLMVALAISQRGPLAVLSRDARPQVRPSRLGPWAPPVMGAAFAFGWTPCIGPILTVVLTTAATKDTLVQGVMLLVAYSLGLGTPFLLSALGLHKFFLRARPHLRPVNIASGLLLAGFGVVMLTGNLSRLSAFFTNIIVNIPFLENLSQI
jgi:cytochrome c-type biogenesis protein